MHRHGFGLSLRSYGPEVVTHIHDHHQTVFAIAGRLEQRIGGAAGILTHAQWAVIRPGESHSFRATGPNRFIVLDTDRPIGAAGPPIRMLDPELTGLVRYAAAELEGAALPASLGFHLAALLAGKLRDAESRNAAIADPIARSLGIMAARYPEPLTVAMLAKAVGLGVSQFHALFRSRTGMTPAEALASARLDAAAAMLAHARLSIAEIALAVGFSDQAALTRAFRRRRATTPGALRRHQPKNRSNQANVSAGASSAM